MKKDTILQWDSRNWKPALDIIFKCYSLRRNRHNISGKLRPASSMVVVPGELSRTTNLSIAKK